MTTDLFLGLILFAFVSSITPGPNNMMLLSSGLTFGFRRTIPHMLGVALGHAAMVLAIGFGLGEVFERVPQAYTALKIIGAGYMLYLAWRIATSGKVEAKEGNARPLTFFQAALFQWVNPKGVIMAVTVVSLYTVPANFTASLMIAATVFLLSNFVSVSTWTAFGSMLQRFLSDPRAVRRFNIVMAVLLVMSLIPMLWT
ncbi:MAG: LysE family translocator [Bauldia sp.]|nr:LysE family translocator [Bauldia sp.]MCW5717707.1 LysE family translocator [Bauldia sp.]